MVKPFRFNYYNELIRLAANNVVSRIDAASNLFFSNDNVKFLSFEHNNDRHVIVHLGSSHIMFVSIADNVFFLFVHQLMNVYSLMSPFS